MAEREQRDIVIDGPLLRGEQVSGVETEPVDVQPALGYGDEPDTRSYMVIRSRYEWFVYFCSHFQIIAPTAIAGVLIMNTTQRALFFRRLDENRTRNDGLTQEYIRFAADARVLLGELDEYADAHTWPPIEELIELHRNDEYLAELRYNNDLIIAAMTGYGMRWPAIIDRIPGIHTLPAWNTLEREMSVGDPSPGAPQDFGSLGSGGDPAYETEPGEPPVARDTVGGDDVDLYVDGVAVSPIAGAPQDLGSVGEDAYAPDEPVYDPGPAPPEEDRVIIGSTVGGDSVTSTGPVISGSITRPNLDVNAPGGDINFNSEHVTFNTSGVISGVELDSACMNEIRHMIREEAGGRADLRALDYVFPEIVNRFQAYLDANIQGLGDLINMLNNELLTVMADTRAEYVTRQQDQYTSQGSLSPSDSPAEVPRRVDGVSTDGAARNRPGSFRGDPVDGLI